MSPNQTTEKRKESISLALSGIVFSTVGMAGVLFPAWKTFAILCASAGLLTSIFSFFRARKTGAGTSKSIVGIFIGVLALYTAILISVLKHIDAPIETESRDIEQNVSSH